MPAGAVCGDLVDVTDFLPTLCDAAGVALPDDFFTDGRSFLPQLRGERGRPREWIYHWYNPLRTGRDLVPTVEMAFTRDFKLYGSGEFYDWRTDPSEERPLDADRVTGEAAAAVQTLREAIGRFAQARPAEVEARARAVRESTRVRTHGLCRKLVSCLPEEFALQTCCGNERRPTMLTTLLMLAPLTVIVEDVRSDAGQIYISVQTAEEYMADRGTGGSIETPEKGTMRLDYDVPAGTYAVSVWHDEDDDGVFDRAENGMPLDGWALSGDGEGWHFDAVKVKVEGNGTIVRVRMQYPR